MKPINVAALGVQFRFTEWLVGELPDPDTAMVSGEFVALLLTVTFPDKLPVVVGEKTTLNEVACPGFSVRGRASPERLKPLPPTLAWDTDTLEFPELVSETLWVALVPVVTLPKLSDEGVGVS